MKRFNLVSLLVTLFIAFSSLSFAGVIPTNLEVFDETVVGAKIDLPDLIKITEKSSLGIEAGVTSLHQDWKDSGFVFLKFTAKWSLIDFTR